jgi:hypothetical protein
MLRHVRPPMIKLFCDLTNGQFASSFTDRSEPRHAFSQNNDLEHRLYLLQSLNSPRWPFSYDSWSGDEDVTAIVSLRDLSTAAPLASTAPLNPIKNGFQGILHTNTLEVAQLLSGKCQATAGLSIELVDGSGNKINPFRREILLRATPGATATSVGTVLYFPEVTTYLGSGPDALQSKPTLGRSGAIFEAFINGRFVAWRIEPGTAETDLDLGIIKPLDFDSDSNAVNLVRGLGI